MDKEVNPWKVTSEKEVYDNAWINVKEFQVINPAGNPGVYGKVHFKNRAIGIVPIDEEGNTYLVGQYRFPVQEYSWEIPEGGGPLGKDYLDSAKRELKEETGLLAENWLKIMDLQLSNSVSDEWATIFLARDLKMGEAMPEETEQLSVKKLPFEEAYQMVVNGMITDAMAVAGILKVKLLKLEGKIK